MRLQVNQLDFRRSLNSAMHAPQSGPSAKPHDSNSSSNQPVHLVVQFLRSPSGVEKLDKPHLSRASLCSSPRARFAEGECGAIDWVFAQERCTKMARAFSLVLLLACIVACALSFAPAGLRARHSALSMQQQQLGEPGTASTPSSTRSQRVAQLQRFSSVFAPAMAAALSAPLLVRAAEATAAAATADAPVKVPLGPPPTNFGLAFKDFYTDCQQVRWGKGVSGGGMLYAGGCKGGCGGGGDSEGCQRPLGT